MSFVSLRPQPDALDPRASSLLESAGDPRDGRLVLLGLPFDSSIPSRSGARLGPRAFREALSSLTTFDGEVELSGHRCLDLGDLDLPSTDVKATHDIVESAAQLIFRTRAVPFFIGGDNGLTGALIRGLAAAQPTLKLGLAVIDSHYDVREYRDDRSLSSGTPYRRALETSICTGERTVIIGTRSFANSYYYHRWIEEQGVTTISVDDFDRRSARDVAEEVRRRLDNVADAIFLSIDIDAIASGEAPGSSAAAPGGLRAREAITIVREMSRSPRFIGADLSELSPPWDVQNMTAKLAARFFLEVFAGSVSSGRIAASGKDAK